MWGLEASKGPDPETGQRKHDGFSQFKSTLFIWRLSQSTSSQGAEQQNPKPGPQASNGEEEPLNQPPGSVSRMNVENIIKVPKWKRLRSSNKDKQLNFLDFSTFCVFMIIRSRLTWIGGKLFSVFNSFACFTPSKCLRKVYKKDKTFMLMFPRQL